jgi:acyl-CoA thioesterase II
LTLDMCVGPPEARHLFGGLGLAAGVSAMERACGRPLIWATAHFVSFASCGECLELSVEVLGESRHVTHACVVARASERLVFLVSGALGAREGEASGQWSRMPVVGPPESYPVAEHWRADLASLHGQLQVRVAKGRYGRDRVGAPETDGRLLLWIRSKPAVQVDAALLAVIADLLPNGVGNAVGMNAGGTSLDNALRVLRCVPTTWILADILIEGIESGVAHGTVRLFAETGELLAVASQSLVMRVRNVP